MHHAVETSRVLEEVVDTGHDAEDTEGEKVDTDDSDDTCLSTNEPTEQTEEGGDEIDNRDGTSELPTGDGAPEGTVGTSNEDEPVLSEGDLEEEDFIALTKVLDDTTAGDESGGEGDPSTDSKNDSNDSGDSPKFRKVPFDGGLAEGRVIVSNGKGGNISEDSDKDNQFQLQTGVEDHDPETKEDFQMERQSDTVDNVGVHTMEDLSGSLESVNDSRETRGKEDNIGGGPCGIRGTFDGDTSISLLQ